MNYYFVTILCKPIAHIQGVWADNKRDALKEARKIYGRLPRGSYATLSR